MGALVEVSRATDVESLGLFRRRRAYRDQDGLGMSWQMCSKADTRPHSRGMAVGSADGSQRLMPTPMKQRPRAAVIHYLYLCLVEFS